MVWFSQSYIVKASKSIFYLLVPDSWHISIQKLHSVPSLTSVEIFQIYTQQMQDENPAEYVNTSGKRNIWIQSCSIRSFSQCPRKQGNTSSKHPPPCQDSAKNDGVFVSQ